MKHAPIKMLRFLCCQRTFAEGEYPDQDSEGFMVCPEHGLRRYGWRSPRSKRYKSVPFDPANPTYVWHIDYSESRLAQDQDIFNIHFGSMPIVVPLIAEVLSPEELQELEELRSR